MTEYVKIASEAGDQYLAALADTQEQFLKYMRAFAAAWGPSTAPLPRPFNGFFPSASEIVSANFAFAEKWLKQQQAFTEKLLATTVPA